MRGKELLIVITLTTPGSPPPMRGKGVADLFDDALGSPPPMRGKDVFVLITIFMRRITPAYAGKRPMHQWCRKTASRDHPRLCGEKPENTAAMQITPAYAGKRSESSGSSRKAGITPAYAGKRFFCRTMQTTIRQGSPPPMRGKGSVSCKIVFGDHPRLCGEKFNREYCKIWNEWGSPPPMRGKATGTKAQTTKKGSPPRMRGKVSSSVVSPIREHEDHPRVCGEKIYLDEVLPADTGSPAYAGKSR